MDKVSVITIVYNDKEHILYTMCSVIEQTYDHIEYILIDGKSSDGTTELIIDKIQDIASVSLHTKDDDKLYIEAIDRLNPSKTYKILSQKDGGIYDAMNKGIDLATGKWCNFMNCGDRFYEKETIEKLFDMYDSERLCKILYGDACIVFSPKYKKILTSSDKSHKYHHHFVHQSAFIDSDVMKKYRYDTSFKIAGDSDFFTRAYNDDLVFMHMPIVISEFNVEGVSGEISWKMFSEDCKIGYKYNRLFPLWHGLYYIFWVLPRTCVRNALPKSIRNQARVLLGKKSQ